MKEGDIVLADIPQVDGTSKIRPVLLLRQLPPPYKDYLVCGISSQLHQKIDDFDEPVMEHDEDFKNSGLVKDSIIRLSFLAVLSKKLIAGTIGQISKERHKKIIQRLSGYLIECIT